MDPRVILLLFGLPGTGASVAAEFRINPAHVTQVDCERAMREQPFILGCGIIRTGRSTVYEIPEDFSRLLIERVDWKRAEDYRAVMVKHGDDAAKMMPLAA